MKSSSISTAMEAERRDSRRFLSLSLRLFAIFLLYTFTVPANHSEAEDVYHYAKLVEEGDFFAMADANRLLSLPVLGAVYRAARFAGYTGRAFPLMIVTNRLAAIGVLFLFYLLVRQITENDRKARGGMLLLAFSYGFWRYANEGEVYLISLLPVLGAWILAFRGRWVWSGLAGGAALLFHLLNLPAVLGALPVWFLLRREWKKAAGYTALVAVVAAAGYLAAFHVLDWRYLGRHTHPLEAGLSAMNLLRAAVAMGQDVVSGNFLFGFAWFREAMVRVFPSRMFGEEFYMASQMPDWIAPLGLAMLILVGFAFFVSLTRPRKEEGNRALWAAVAVWGAGYAAAVLLTEAGSPELWLMGLVPLWLVLAPFLAPRRAAFLVAMLFLHNLFAGLLPVIPEKGDYHAAKCEWIIHHAGPKDVILSGYEPVLIFYLRYHSPACVVNSAKVDKGKIERILGKCDGEVYAFASFFEPLSSMQVREPASARRMQRLGAAFRPRFDKVYDDPFGGIYQLKKEGGTR